MPDSAQNTLPNMGNAEPVLFEPHRASEEWPSNVFENVLNRRFDGLQERKT